MGLLRNGGFAFGAWMACFAGTPASALGPDTAAGFKTFVALVGHENDSTNCYVEFEFSPDFRQFPATNFSYAHVRFANPYFVPEEWPFVGGSRFRINAVQAGLKDITAADLEAACNLSNVTNLVTDGADGAFASDDFIGMRFRAVHNGEFYDYVVGLTGATDTTIVNSRSVAPNDPPVADAGPDLEVTAGETVILDDSGSTDADGPFPLTRQWRFVGTPAGRIILRGLEPFWRYEPPAIPVGESIQVTIELTVNDGRATDTDTVVITAYGPPNTPPTADAGTGGLVETGSTAFLDASGSSDPDPGTVLTYSWAQTDGPPATLIDPTSELAQLVAPSLDPGDPPVTLTFELTVSDGTDSDTDTVSYTVFPPNDPPLADAGADQIVNSFQQVALDGSGSSDPDPAQTLTYSWVQTGGTAATLTGAATATPGFAAPRIAPASIEVLTFQLTVSDGFETATDTVEISVIGPPDTLPAANAGLDQTVASEAQVTLDGSGSVDPDVGQTKTYRWRQISGPAVTLTGADTATPGFTAPRLFIGTQNQRLLFELEFSDGPNTDVDTVEILVLSPPNTPPTANAGPDFQAFQRTVVSLSGLASSSNDPGQPLVYEWSQVAGPSVNFVINVPTTGFLAPAVAPGAPPVTMTFSLRVDDGFGWSVPDQVTVLIVADRNTAPIADAGPDQTVDPGDTVSLDGSSSSDPDAASGPLAFAWVQTAGPTVTLAASDTATPSFVAPNVAPGTTEVLEFELSVQDSYAAATDTVSITVNGPPATAPVADAGPDQTVASGSTVALDGSGSSDPNNDQLSYLWTQTSGPRVALADGATVAPQFATPVLQPGDAPVDLVFQLIVSDGTEASLPDTVTVRVTPPGFGERPGVVISSPAEYPATGSFTVTIGFSEPVTGFDVSDLTVTNASVLSVSGGPQAFVATLSPAAHPQPISIAVPENVAFDNESMGNLAAGPVVIDGSTLAPTQETVAKHLQQRNRALLASQPNLRRFLGANTGNGFTFASTKGRSTLELGLGSDGPLWMALSGSWTKTGDAQQDYVHLTFGSHLLRGENLILGAMLQLDDSRITEPGEVFRGEGWLVGPYLVARAADRPLVFSAAILAGETRNRLARDGLGTDRFETRRLLATAGLEGRIVTASGLVLIPSFDIAHVRDRQAAYVDATATPVAAQTISLTEATFGLGVEKTLEGAAGPVVLSGKLSGILSDEGGGTSGVEGLRGRLDLGADVTLSPLSSLKLQAFWDGIGSADYTAWGADLLLELKF